MAQAQLPLSPLLMESIEHDGPDVDYTPPVMGNNLHQSDDDDSDGDYADLPESERLRYENRRWPSRESHDRYGNHIIHPSPAVTPLPIRWPPSNKTPDPLDRHTPIATTEKIFRHEAIPANEHIAGRARTACPLSITVAATIANAVPLRAPEWSPLTDGGTPPPRPLNPPFPARKRARADDDDDDDDENNRAPKRVRTPFGTPLYTNLSPSPTPSSSLGSPSPSPTPTPTPPPPARSGITLNLRPLAARMGIVPRATGSSRIRIRIRFAPPKRHRLTETDRGLFALWQRSERAGRKLESAESELAALGRRANQRTRLFVEKMRVWGEEKVRWTRRYGAACERLAARERRVGREWIAVWGCSIERAWR